MDDMIFEEFKGTGNMEVHLDRKLQEEEYSQQSIYINQELEKKIYYYHQKN